MSVEEKKHALINRMHEDVPLLEALSDMELVSMDNYNGIVDAANNFLLTLTDTEVEKWYNEWLA